MKQRAKQKRWTRGRVLWTRPTRALPIERKKRKERVESSGKRGRENSAGAYLQLKKQTGSDTKREISQRGEGKRGLQGGGLKFDRRGKFVLPEGGGES